MKALGCLVVMALIVASMLESGQSKGSSCASTFFSSLLQLTPCRGAVSPFGPLPPNEACCSAVIALGQPCLCVLVNGPPLPGVDPSLAAHLPQQCSISFEPCELLSK